MGTVTTTILLAIVIGVFAFAAWGVNTLQHYEKQYRELIKFIDECDNTAANFKTASDEAIKLTESRFIEERDLAHLRRKIYNKFRLL
jgi:hypothetical protein